jgi:dienelactone hydrolase
VLLEAPENRPEAAATILDASNDRREIVQTVVELRRAFDLLVARKDVDPKRLGYVGWSLGATMGARLAGLEPRAKAFVMMAGWASYSRPARDGHGVFGAAFHAFLTPEAQAAWLATIEPLDGTHFMDGRPSMLLQFALRDPFISATDAALYREAAGLRSESREYDVGHFELGAAEARRDREEWLARQLALASH